ncbi:hypothetical protein, partial [Staphylococcus hominis]|uniref:hypothetical protein n=1 Tax=Staphylococcus hominis TaxID=1290 RepID=UPI0016434058
FCVIFMVTTNKTIPNPAYEMLNKKLLNESTIPLMILIDIIINGREIKKVVNIVNDEGERKIIIVCGGGKRDT